MKQNIYTYIHTYLGSELVHILRLTKCKFNQATLIISFKQEGVSRLRLVGVELYFRVFVPLFCKKESQMTQVIHYEVVSIDSLIFAVSNIYRTRTNTRVRFF